MTKQIPAKARCAVCGKLIEVRIICLERPETDAFKSIKAKKLQMRGWSMMFGDHGPWVCSDSECREYVGMFGPAKVGG